MQDTIEIGAIGQLRSFYLLQFIWFIFKLISMYPTVSDCSRSELDFIFVRSDCFSENVLFSLILIYQYIYYIFINQYRLGKG